MDILEREFENSQILPGAVSALTRKLNALQGRQSATQTNVELSQTAGGGGGTKCLVALRSPADK